jgi:UDP-N-acetylglucosamine enolpyruvyl transferase
MMAAALADGVTVLKCRVTRSCRFGQLLDAMGANVSAQARTSRGVEKLHAAEHRICRIA